MSRGRRSAPTGDSLDLLLDTICNTFGGILFLAILVALMLQNSSLSEVQSEEPTISPLELAELEREYSELQQERSGLRAIVQQQTALAAQLANPQSQTALEELHEQQRRRDSLEQELAETLQTRTRQQAEIQEINAELERLDQRKTELQQQLAQVNGELRREVEARSQATRLPRLRNTAKREIQLVVRYGRLYVWHRYDDLGMRIGLNTDDFFILEQSLRGVRTTPKPYAGTPIDSSEEARAQIKSVLSRFRKERQYLAMTVWVDSFDKFQDLKQVMVELGFEYRLLAAVPGDLYFDRGGRGGTVQ